MPTKPKRTSSSLLWGLFLLWLSPAQAAWADTWQIPAENRDAWDDTSSGNIDLADFGDSSWDDTGGYQWAVTIPRGALITSAKVRVHPFSRIGAGGYTVRIRVEDVDNAIAFNGAPNNIRSRIFWSTTVDWVLPGGGLTVGTYNDSPDITTLIQHIVDRPGWSSGNYIGIAIWGQTATGGSREQIDDWPTNPAELVVTWEPPPPIYRSIGNAADYNTGSITATLGSLKVTGVGTAWKSSNRGRGDRINIDGTNYTVQQVNSDTELTLTRQATATYSGTNYMIARQFDNLTLWEDCIDGVGNGGTCAPFPEVTNDLVADDRNEVGIAYKDSVFTDSLVIDALTDATHFITLTADAGNRHAGIAGNPGDHVIVDPSGASHGIRVLSDYTHVEWLEITGWTGSGNEGVRIEADQTSYSHLIVHDPGAADPNADGFHFKDDGDWTATIRNTIIYGVDRSCIYLLQNNTTWNMVLNLENVTAYGCGFNSVNPEEAAGVSACAHIPGSATINATNVISVDNPPGVDFNIVRNVDCDKDALWGSSDFNLDSDGSAPGGTTFTSNGATEFVSTTGVIDLHLRSTATAIDMGSTRPGFSTDIDGENRPQGGVWEIGADEAVGTGTCPTIIRPWFDTAWAYRKAIALNSTLVAGPLSNFPVLVVLDNDVDIQTPTTQANFEDIVFTAADGVTQLPHEIEAYDSAQGDLTAWVKVPYVSNGSDTIIYIYYGNLGATDQRDPTNVWDANHAGVWHLVEAPAEGVAGHLDSTGAGLDGTPFGFADGGGGNTSAVGQMAGADYFADDASGDHNRVEVPNDASLYPPGDLTAEAWIYLDDPATAHTVLYQWDGAWFSYQIYVATDGVGGYVANFQWSDTTETMAGSPAANGTTQLQPNVWYHVVGVRRGTDVEIFVDGGIEGTNGGAVGMTNPTVNPLVIGAVYWGVGSLGGRVDEVRISDTARSPEWIETSYNNQFDPIADPAGFCKVCAQATAVSLESFEASGFEGEVELEWRTASELNNLGFHLYRGTTEGGPYERITERMIPGLMSSAAGARYTYRDTGLANGTTYYYELEDIESRGKTTRHGPVSATPQLGVHEEPREEIFPEEEEETSNARITYGDPTANTFEIVRRAANGVTLRLDTAGFYAEPLEDGTVRISIPGLDELTGESSLPVKRSWLDSVPGLKVNLAFVKAMQIESIEGLQPAGSAVDELVASRKGTVRMRRRRLQKAFKGKGLVPAEAARIVSVGFQGDAKKALVEMAPLRWDEAAGRLLLAKRLEVRVVFRGRDLDEGWSGSRFRGGRNVLARLVTQERGLYGARFEDVFGKRKAIRTRSLRLSRQGEAVAYHVEPNPNRFGPGSTLYFLGEGAAVNPYGNEAVYELEMGEGDTMEVSSELPSGELTPFYWNELAREKNGFYQAALLQAPDVWLWDLLMATETKSYSFDVSTLAPATEPSHATVWLQGTSDEPVAVDHHIRAYVNGTFVGESSWDGKRALALQAEIHPGVLVPGENLLELENVGDTGSDFSMVMLDRFSLRHPSPVTLENGKLEGTWSVSGVAELSEAFVLDVTEAVPKWIGKTSRFRAHAEHRYLATDAEALLRPDVERPRATGLTSKKNGADYIVVGSREFLRAAEPLLAHRRSDGLRIVGVPTEEVFSEFGYGEKTPDAIRHFLAYAYHEWREPSPRYVLLLGDASFDYKDYLQTGVINHVPPTMVKTSYLWTASDPAYAAVNGDDILPDLAIGRLPAADADELRVMVEKILAYETGTASLDAPVVLVADNADAAGHFETDADELLTTVLAGRDHRRIYLSELGTTAARSGILTAFDEGASLMSYIGHGAIHLWADELVFRTGQISSLAPQSQQPLVLTMNCLNGYFHFPYFDSLAEGLVKAEGKGAIAAFSPSGLSLNAPAKRYHEALLREIFHANHARIGDAVLAAQEAYAATGAFPELLSIYHLFGDPGLKLREQH